MRHHRLALAVALVLTASATLAHSQTAPEPPTPDRLASAPGDAQQDVTSPQASDDVAQAQGLSRLERWAGSYNGCMGGATPEERAMAVSMEYTCACLATYIVNLCAPTDATTNEQVMACFESNQVVVQNAFTSCLQYGPLQVHQ